MRFWYALDDISLSMAFNYYMWCQHSVYRGKTINVNPFESKNDYITFTIIFVLCVWLNKASPVHFECHITTAGFHVHCVVFLNFAYMTTSTLNNGDGHFYRKQIDMVWTVLLSHGLPVGCITDSVIEPDIPPSHNCFYFVYMYVRSSSDVEGCHYE